MVERLSSPPPADKVSYSQPRKVQHNEENKLDSVVAIQHSNYLFILTHVKAEEFYAHVTL